MTPVRVQVGQIRRHPDKRLLGCCVRVVEVGVPALYHQDEPAALVQAVVQAASGAWYPTTSRSTRVRERYLARWEVVDGQR